MSPAHLRMSAFAAAAAVAALVAGTDAQQPASTLDEGALSAAIERALAAAPRGFTRLQSPSQAGVRLAGVGVQRVAADAQRITIDLSQRALTYDPSGDVEALLDEVIRSTAALTGRAGNVEYRFLVDGLPLDTFLARAAPPSRRRATGAPPRALISAGHGWYWDEDVHAWRLQRDYFWGIVEDFVNWDMADRVRTALAGTVFDAWPARHPDRHAAAGISGRPGWEEGAVYFVRSLGAPPEIWNIGAHDYARDINTRPFYANWIDAALVISIHNNGGGGTGTETWYDESNGFGAESARLAEIVNRNVVSAIRASWNPLWPDRGLRSCNGCKGENRLAARPAVILEVAFMDMKSPDNDALHDERFTQIVAGAIRGALHEWAGLPDAGADEAEISTDQ